MADVAATLRLWSATVGSNMPAGTTIIGAGLDDNLRQIQATVRQFLASQGTNMASGTTVDLATADGYYVVVTGTTTITGLGTEVAGISYWLKFAGALTLTHNGTSLILPGAANITTAAGDICRVTSEGSGNWRCTSYQRASGLAIAVASVASVPAGAILDFGGTSAPSGYLGCDGASYLRADYPDLFTAIGTTWGAADGTHFNVPNFQRKVAVGSGGSGTATLANTVGSTGGEETHTLITAEMPAHTHTVALGSGAISASNNVGAVVTAGPTTSSSTGGDGAHNNIQPSNVVLKIIKT